MARSDTAKSVLRTRDDSVWHKRELPTLRRSLRRLANRIRWRRLAQLRASRLSGAIRAVETAVGRCSRRKEGTEWRFYTRVGEVRVDAVVLSASPPALFSDFARPIEVELLVPELVDDAVLLPRLRKLGVRVR